MDAGGMETPKKSNRGLWIGLGVGCLALLVCGAIGAALVFGGVFSFLTTAAPVLENVAPELQATLQGLESGLEEPEEEDPFAEPTDVRISLEGPEAVAVGESFELLVRVSNTATEAQMLDSIDFGEEYLEGISIQSADPSFSDSFSYPGFYSYTFNRSIPAGGELIVRFRAEAQQAGEFEGPLDVCINSPVNCLRETVRTSVSP